MKYTLDLINNTLLNGNIPNVDNGMNPDGVAYDSANGGATNTVVDNITVGSYPVGVGYDSANGYVYVANDGSDSVSVIDGATNTVVDNIAVRGGPDAVAYDSANGYVYVANSLSDSVSVIDGATNSVVDNITVGVVPVGVAYDSANGYIYVANIGSGSVSVIDGATNTVVDNITVGPDPEAVGYDSANGYVYVANDGSDTVSVISTSAIQLYSVAFTESGLPPGTTWAVTLNGATETSTTNTVSFSEPNGTYSYSVGNVSGYLASPSSGTIIVSGSNVSINIVFSSSSYKTLEQNVAYSNGYVFYANSSYNEVEVISQSTHNIVEVIRTGIYPVSVASYYPLVSVYGSSYNMLRDIVVVANEGSNSVTFINSSNLQVIGNITVGKDPLGIALGNGLVAVGNYGSNNITILNIVNINNGISWVRRFGIPLSDSPTGMVFDFTNNELFVSLYNSHEIEVFNVGVNSNSYSAVGFLTTMANPMGLALDNDGFLYVAQEGSSSIAVFIPNGSIYPSFANFNVIVGNNPVNVVTIDTPAGGYAQEISAVVSYLNSNNVSFIPVGLIGNQKPYFNVTYSGTVSGIGAGDSSWYYVAGGMISSTSVYPVLFSYNGGAVSYSLDGSIVGPPYVYLPGGIPLPSGTYNLNYFLQAGYESPQLSTIGMVSYSSGELDVYGPGTVTVSSTAIQKNWANSGYFHVATYTINLGQIGPVTINSNLVSYPLQIYVLTPTSGESLQTFYDELHYYFNITVPGGYQADTTIILSLQLVPLINGIFEANLPEQVYNIPLGDYLSFLGIQNITMDSSGTLNLAITISSSDHSQELLKDMLNTVLDYLKTFKQVSQGELVKFLITVLATLKDIVQDILDIADITVTDINSSLQDIGKLSGYTVIDLAAIEKSELTILKLGVTTLELVDDTVSILKSLVGFELFTILAAISLPPFDVINAAIARYFAIDGGLHAMDLIMTLANIVWPSLSNNIAFEVFEYGVKIGLVIEDPNGSTIVPSFYVNNTLVLGYNSTDGNVIMHSAYGTLEQLGDQYYGYIYPQYSRWLSVELNNVGGNGSAPYVITVETNSSYLGYVGEVSSNSSLTIPVSVSQSGSIGNITYLSPKLVIKQEADSYLITVSSYLSDGQPYNAASAIAIVGNTDYYMAKVNSTSFQVSIPFDKISSNVVMVYVPSSQYPGGYVSAYLPLYEIIFLENGLPYGSYWNVTLGNTTQYSYSNDTVFYVPDGSYSFSVGTVEGYVVYPSNGTVLVNGVNVTVKLTFAATFYVTFTESGLPPGTAWSVTLNGTTETSTTNTITFMEPSGTYSFSVGSVGGYTASPSSGTITVSGANVSQPVTFSAVSSTTSTSTPTSTTSTSTATPTPTTSTSHTELYAIVGVVMAVIIIGIAVSLFRRKG